jgi:hypothetical protein
MSRLLMIGLMGLCLGTKILEPKEILLENGKILYFKGVSDSEIDYLESQVGCSTKCASACLSFSQGSLLVECTNHCGCSSLFSSEPEVSNLYKSDYSLDVVLPKSTEDDLEIYIQDQKNKDIKVSIGVDEEKYSQYSTETITTVINDDHYSKTDDVTFTVEAKKGRSYSEITSSYNSSGKQEFSTDFYESSYQNGNKAEEYIYAEVDHDKKYDYISYDLDTSKDTKGNLNTSTSVYGYVGGDSFRYKEKSTNHAANGYVYGSSNETYYGYYNQEATQSIGSNLVQWGLLALCILVVGFFVYKKFTQIKAFRYNISVKAVDEESPNYIRL